MKRIFMALYARVDERTFDVNKGGFGVRIPSASGKETVLYPDIVVDLQSGAGGEPLTSQPVVVIEVASSHADREHHVQILEHYKKRETLRQYVMFDHKELRAYAWTKTEVGWSAGPGKTESTGGVVDLPSIGATIPLAEIYRSNEAV